MKKKNDRETCKSSAQNAIGYDLWFRAQVINTLNVANSKIAIWFTPEDVRARMMQRSQNRATEPAKT